MVYLYILDGIYYGFYYRSLTHDWLLLDASSCYVATMNAIYPFFNDVNRCYSSSSVAVPLRLRNKSGENEQESAGEGD